MSKDIVLNEKTDNVNEINNSGNQFFSGLFDLNEIKKMKCIDVKTELYDIDVLNSLVLTDKISSAEKLKLKGYLKKSKGNRVDVSYKWERKNNEDRYYAKGGLSLQSMDRNVRALLGKKYYNDVDICNSHPTIIYNLCKSKGISSPCIEGYVKNRDKIVEGVMNEYDMNYKDAKQKIISVINGQVDHGYLKPLRDEMINIRNIVKGLYMMLMSRKCVVLFSSLNEDL